MFEIRYIAAQVAFYRSCEPRVIYRVDEVILHPALAAASYVPAIACPIIIKTCGAICSFDGLKD